MAKHPLSALRRIALALGACGLLTSSALVPSRVAAGDGGDPFDPLLDARGPGCARAAGGPPRVIQAMLLAQAEAAKAAPAAAASDDMPPLYTDLGRLHFEASTRNARAQAYVDQGLRLAFGFNHAEALRAFRAAQKLDPDCPMCFWGAALVLGPNINVPMMPEANAPALDALARAVALEDKASSRERALIEALRTRYAADPKADRPALDAAYADAMKATAARYPDDDTILALYAEAAMDTQPWDYWEAGGARPKGRGAEIVRTLETVLARDPDHAGAIHLYIHAMEASTQPDKALPAARRLAALMPGAGHIVHMPAHIYYRVGLYRESMTLNQRAVEVDEHYFGTSPSDPIYKSAYYPHNLHFVMVSALMGGDGTTALAAAAKLDASVPMDLVRQFAILEAIKAAPYAAMARFADPDAVLALRAPDERPPIINAMYHHARAIALASRKDASGARAEIDAIAAIEGAADFAPYEPWGVPAKSIVRTARLVATARLADAQGDLAGAARAYGEAVAIEETLPYTEPPYWYYPVRQSLGGVFLRQGRLDEAEAAFRDSLGRVRGNAWALAGLAEVERRKGDRGAETAARKAYAEAWFGPEAGPDLAKL
jgi:tetratricopeptide (TPR) repeat protein